MLHAIGRTALAQLQSLLGGFLQDGSFPFGSVLTVKDIVDLISQECVETGERIFTPLVTLCTFLSQIHSDDPSCRAVVAHLNAMRVTQGLQPSSPLTGGYCKARQRLPESLLQRLLSLSGQRLKQQVPAEPRKSGSDWNSVKLSPTTQFINELRASRCDRIAVSRIGSMFDGAG